MQLYSRSFLDLSRKVSVQIVHIFF